MYKDYSKKIQLNFKIKLNINNQFKQVKITIIKIKNKMKYFNTA